MEILHIDYVSAAQIIATCPPERLGVVSALLKQGGIEVPQIEQTGCSEHNAKPKNSSVTRIDRESAELLEMLRQQTGLTMIMLASRLIKEGYKTFDRDKEV